MSVRRNRITGEPILYAPERAARPGAFGDRSPERCPFCPGHEVDTPPAIASIGDPWRIRVFANKYPPADGAEVIVESSDHDATFASIADPVECVAMYRDRFAAHAGAPHVSLFRNEGAAAGSSVPHAHSQLVPLPFVPPRIEREIAGFRRASNCPLCADGGDVVIAETPRFRWVAPEDSWMPYQQRIVPKPHVQELAALDGREQDELADLLQRAARATTKIAPSWNWMFLPFPRVAEAHLYIELFPRVTTIAGLELATGTFVEIIDPAAAARLLTSTR